MKNNAFYLVMCLIWLLSACAKESINNETFASKELEFMDNGMATNSQIDFEPRRTSRVFFVNYDKKSSEAIQVQSENFSYFVQQRDWQKLDELLKSEIKQLNPSQFPHANTQMRVCTFINSCLLDREVNTQNLDLLAYYLDFIKTQKTPDWELWVASLKYAKNKMSSDKFEYYTKHLKTLSKEEKRRIETFVNEQKAKAKQEKNLEVVQRLNYGLKASEANLKRIENLNKLLSGWQN